MNLEKLESEVKRSRYFIVFAAITPAIIYMLWFAVKNDQQLSTDAGLWGTFGDFVGGLINPLIAYFAFYWLTQSVLIQKTELSETKNALVAAQYAQQKQASTALKAATLQSLSIRLNAINQEISFEQDILKFVISEAQRNGSHYTVMLPNGEQKLPGKAIPEIHDRLDALKTKQAKLMQAVEQLQVDA
ncbi:hypothetical protein LX59_02166 [Azomonas agilis]|uniref:Uncharacterized protein n=1 Tax=Azomonas agilis TaxID=116849 RepID=A0A562I2A4_9GAMM|nr:hypothetical protein [Azomonas agilis]TWH64818.1 hypothetical protein LX59_02166 [Azomonas agilis]